MLVSIFVINEIIVDWKLTLCEYIIGYWNSKIIKKILLIYRTHLLVYDLYDVYCKY
jgi:hypothetical protein